MNRCEYFLGVSSNCSLVYLAVDNGCGSMRGSTAAIPARRVSEGLTKSLADASGWCSSGAELRAPTFCSKLGGTRHGVGTNGLTGCRLLAPGSEGASWAFARMLRFRLIDISRRPCERKK